MTSKDGTPVSRTEQAKQLLTQYGSAYLLTSISFAIVSFACCYAAVNAGARRPAAAKHTGVPAPPPDAAAADAPSSSSSCHVTT